MALLLVLWVLALLTVISGEFCRAMRTEANISRNYRDVTQAYYAAVGGVNMAIYQILSNGMIPKTSADETDIEVEDQINWRLNADIPEIKIGFGSAAIRIDNESGKVNINVADEGLLRLMINGFDLSKEDKAIIVASILDWRDADSLHRLNGAENDYYQSLAEPYACKNGDFDEIEELLRVRGITPEIFHNGLSKIVTVYPGRDYLEKTERWVKGQKKPKGIFDYNRININAASPELLKVLPGFSEEIVEAIIAYRQEKDFQSDDQLIETIGASEFAGVRNYLTYALSPYYRIQAFGTVAQSEALQGVSALIGVNLKTEKKYHIIQWIDHMSPAEIGWGNVLKNDS